MMVPLSSLRAVLCLVVFSNYAADQPYTISLHPCWHVLDPAQPMIFPAPWVHITTIMLKKKAPEHLRLDHLALWWYGKKITTISASLYRKPTGQPFVAIEKNFIGDSQWSHKQQRLLFSFNKSINLEVINEFCLVCAVPKALQFLLTQGYFELDSTDQPDCLAHVLHDNPARLDFRTIDISSLS